MPRTCPRCNTVTDSQAAKFCTHCGASLQQPPTPPHQPLSWEEGRSPDPYSLEAIGRTFFLAGGSVASDLQNLFKVMGATPVCIFPYNPTHNDDAQKKAVRDKLKSLSDQGSVDYVCIVGSWNDVPPYEIDNPINEGPGGDSTIKTDVFYGLEIVPEAVHVTGSPDWNGDALLHQLAVSRIPSSEINVISRLLFSANPSTPFGDAFMFAVSAECWKDATAFISTRLTSPSKKPLYCSPDLCEEDFLGKTSAFGPDGKPLVRDGLMLFNVHGSDSETAWYGQREDDYPEVFRPDTVPDFSGGIIFSEACFGASLGYVDPGIAERFFLSGGRNFAGCSAIAWGCSCATDADVSNADKMALCFLKHYKEGSTVGEAIVRARVEVLECDSENQLHALKTHFTFCLYGVPWTSLSCSAPAGEDQVNATRILDEIRSRPTFSSTFRSGDLVSGIRQRYRSRLPLNCQAFLLNADEARKRLGLLASGQQLRTFFEQEGSDIEAATWTEVSGAKGSFYIICGRNRNRKSSSAFSIIVNSDGVLKKTLYSKGSL